MWNHRVLAHEGLIGEIWLQIHEVYYSKDGKPNGYTENAISLGSETTDGLLWTLKEMKKCLNEPILWAGEKFPKEYKNQQEKL